MKKPICTIVTITLLSGCQNLSLQNFDKSPYSMTYNNKSEVTLHNGENDWENAPALKKYIANNPELQTAISKSCTNPSVALNPVLIPIATSVGKLLFDLQIDKKTKDIEKIKKAAQVTYSNRIIMPSEDFRKYSCATMYRYNESDSKIGFISALRIDDKNDGFTITPIYVRANNTAAITKRPMEGKSAKINVSIAASIKSIGGKKHDLPTLTAIGEGVTTVHDIDVGPTASAHCSTGCESTDILPYIADDKRTISVTLAITETGKIGIDLDEKLSESKAIKEALGPALKETLKEYLKEEE